MENALLAGRAQFAFTIMFHYLFPVLTMGLGVLIAVLKTCEFFGNRPVSEFESRSGREPGTRPVPI
jgi:cytochrome bd-type quinol oxidase subunit 1